MDWNAVKRKVSSEAFASMTNGPIEGEFLSIIFCDILDHPRLVNHALRDLAETVRCSILTWPASETGRLKALFPTSFALALISRKGPIDSPIDEVIEMPKQETSFRMR